MKFLIIFIPFTVFLILACQGSRAGRSNVQLNTEAAEVSHNETTASSAKFTEADFARHVNQVMARIKKTASSADFSIVIQPPFVVIGDESLKVVKQRAADTVKWAVDRLKQDYFTKDPEEILDICYYMQEKGVLVKFYQEFLTHQREDSSGFKNLQKVLAETDMDAFKRKWEKYVLGLGEDFELRPVRP